MIVEVFDIDTGNPYIMLENETKWYIGNPTTPFKWYDIHSSPVQGVISKTIPSGVLSAEEIVELSKAGIRADEIIRLRKEGIL